MIHFRAAVISVCCLAAFVCAARLSAQEPVKPGPEHERLKKMAGVWDTLVKMEGVPDSKGTMTATMECGGLWLVSNVQMDLGGQPFQGKGLDSYDATKKKYVSVWVDSMQSTPMISEGEYDRGKSTLTMISDYPGPDGKPARYRMVSTFNNDNEHAFQMFLKPQGGDESLMMTVEYRRRK